MGFVRSLNTSVIQSISSTGDKCHFNIAISEKEARSVIMGISLMNLRSVLMEIIEALKRKI